MGLDLYGYRTSEWNRRDDEENMLVEELYARKAWGLYHYFQEDGMSTDCEYAFEVEKDCWDCFIKNLEQDNMSEVRAITEKFFEDEEITSENFYIAKNYYENIFDSSVDMEDCYEMFRDLSWAFDWYDNNSHIQEIFKDGDSLVIYGWY